MIRTFTAKFLFCALALLAPRPAAAITMSWTPVGNPGNAADPSTGYGAVGHSYSIGTYDVTNSQYVAFLNSNDPTGADPLAIYNSEMSNATHGGISYNSGNANGSKYSVMLGDGNHPVNYVTWYDAIRFANWMDNGQVGGATETGAYTLLGGTPTPSNGNSITRNAGATIFLPSENEWYKAAYYNPGTSSYYLYPTSSNTAPTGSSPTSTPNSANLSPGGPLNLTDVGSYTGTTSPYGAFDMGGDVYQWNEALFSGSFRRLRGGWYFDGSNNLASSSRGYDDPSVEYSYVGFRVATVPEPSTEVLVILACGMMWVLRKRFK